MRILIILNFVLMVIFCNVRLLAAQECKLISLEGIKGEKPQVVAVDQNHPGILFVGTDKNIYRRDLKSGSWSGIDGLSGKGMNINQVVFGPNKGEVYIATSNGLYFNEDGLRECINKFYRSNELERNCTAVYVSKNKYIFLGTGSGLFVKKNNEEWVKLVALFNNQRIVSIFGTSNSIYVATGSCVYKSLDYGLNWEKVFNSYSYQEVEEPSALGDDPSVGAAEDLIKFNIINITGRDKEQDGLYLATSFGVFSTFDGGKTWIALPFAGLDISKLRHLTVNPNGNELYAAAGSGVYRYADGRWTLFYPGYDCKYLGIKKDSLVFVTEKDIFECFIPAVHGEQKNELNKAGLFKDEPSIGEVQKMAIDYAEVNNSKIVDWRRRAAMKAAFPKISFGFNNNVYGSSNGSVAVGPNDWDFSVSWDLSELIYNSAQTSIDTRSKLLVELRNDILSEVTRLYFERRKLQLDLLMNSDKGLNNNSEKELRLLELSALIDRLTGGNFSKLLKSSN